MSSKVKLGTDSAETGIFSLVHVYHVWVLGGPNIRYVSPIYLEQSFRLNKRSTKPSKFTQRLDVKFKLHGLL